jgi:hypothetical protein
MQTSAKDRAYDILPSVLERFLSATLPFSFEIDGAAARHLYMLLTTRGVRCAYLDGRLSVFLD